MNVRSRYGTRAANKIIAVSEQTKQDIIRSWMWMSPAYVWFTRDATGNFTIEWVSIAAIYPQRNLPSLPNICCMWGPSKSRKTCSR